MAKMEFIPVELDTDWLIIGNLPALKEECLAVKYGEQDTPTSFAKSAAHHRNAVNLLNKELDHYVGRENPSVNFRPFGEADFRGQAVGSLV